MSTIKLDGLLITESFKSLTNNSHNNENGNISQQSSYPTKGFEMRLKIRAEQLVKTARKSEIDTERVRNRKKTKVFQCAKSQKRSQEAKPTVESIALERRKPSSRRENAIIVDHQLPKEVSAFDRNHQRCYYWG